MAGILLYAKPIIRYYSLKQKILHITWEVTAVSMAAQVFILPLLLHHFHQFPLTFVASSLVAMPASYVIIFGTLANVGLASFDIHWFWNLYDALCRYFLLIMKWMAGLNPEMNYSLPELSVVLLFSVAIFLSVSLIYEWQSGKKAAYVLGMATLLTLGCHRSVQWHTDELIIYHQYQGLLADVFTGGQCITIRDSIVNEKSMDFAARGHRCYRDVIHIQPLKKDEAFNSLQWSYVPPLLHFYKSSILFWKDSTVNDEINFRITHLLVDQCTDIRPLKEFICRHDDMQVILPAHLKGPIKNRLAWFLKANSIPFWDISAQGYFKLSR
jgi:hypothetical protein